MAIWQRRKFLQVGFGACALATGNAAWPSRRRNLVEVERSGTALGTTISLRVLHDGAEAGERAIDAAFAEIDRVEEVMSLYRPHSELCRLNRSGRLERPHPWLVAVLQQAAEISRVSRGAFDVTVQPLWQCWSQASRAGRLPTPAELATARRSVDWRSVEVTSSRIVAKRPGMQLTLNGVAQGFAADRAVAALRAAGVAHALIDTGEIQTLGDRRGEPWTVGVQHPRSADSYSALAKLANRALSTSGDYHTTFTSDRRHHHILDPRTGYSATELASATVLAPTALEADALSTTILVLGVERGLELVARRPSVDALLVRKDGSTILTPGFPEEAV